MEEEEKATEAVLTDLVFPSPEGPSLFSEEEEEDQEHEGKVKEKED